MDPRSKAARMWMRMNVRFRARILVMAISLAFVAGALSVSAPNVGASWTFDWNTETPLGAPASQAVVVGSPDGTVYIMGGVTDGTYNAVGSSYSYDAYTGDWTVLASMPGPVRGAAGAMGLNGLVYVFGGDDGSGYTQIYNPASNSWSLGMAMPFPVWEGKAATVGNGSIWVVGGEGAPSAGYTQIYNPVANSWSAGPAAPADVLCGALISDGNDLYYSGGGDGDYAGTTNFFKYDATAGAWTTLVDLPEARAGHAMVMGVDGLIYLVGGSDAGWNWGGTIYSSVAAFDPATDEWSYAVSMDYSRTYLGAVVISDGRIFALGGNTGSTILNVVESLQLYLFEYSIELSATSARAGESVLMVLDAQYTYVEEYYSEVSWYLISDADGIVYNSDGMWLSSDAPFAITVEIPVLAPPGDYRVVVDYWVVYSDDVYEIIEMEEFALEVLPAPAPVDELIAELQAELDALAATLGTTDASVAALTMQVAIIQAKLDGIIAGLTAMGAGQAAAMAELNLTLADLQSQLDDFQEQIDRVEDKADTAGTYGMVTLVLVIVVIVLLALMFMMARKKP